MTNIQFPVKIAHKQFWTLDFVSVAYIIRIMNERVKTQTEKCRKMWDSIQSSIKVNVSSHERMLQSWMELRSEPVILENVYCSGDLI